MKKASIEDIYEVKLMGLVSDVDKLSLIDLYQPLIGVTAIGLYLSLLEDPSKEDNITSNFELLSIKTSLTIGELYSNFEALEAVGLIKTYVKGDDHITYFIFTVYSPLDPKEFFDDVLFVGTLKKQIGEKALNLLEKKYKINVNVNGFEEVSTSFIKYFNPDLHDGCFNVKDCIKAKGHHKAKIKTGFDIVAMLRGISELGIKESDFSSEEINVISKLAVLYTIDESQMGALLSLVMDPTLEIGKKIDLQKLDKLCKKNFGSMFRLEKPLPFMSSDVKDLDDSKIAQKIKLMEEESPAHFLSYLQNGHKPATSDLSIVETLSLEIGLSFPVINALIDYVLTTNNNVLNRVYTEKIGAALAREGVNTALDAMDYLNKTHTTYRKKSNSKIESKEKKEENDNNELSDDDLDKMFEKLKK